MANNIEKITKKIEGKEWQDALDKSFKRRVKDVKIDGFRKGAVPKNVYLEKVGIESLYMDAINEVTNVAYSEALKESKVKAVIEPSLDVTAVDKDSVTFEITFVGKPEIKLGDYKNLKIKKEKVSVSEEEINEEINHLREEYAEISVKESGKVEEKDTAVIDFDGFVDGKALEGGSGKNYPLEIGSHTFIPGFEEAVLGMSVGEEKEINLKFPENYTPELSGKDVVFKVVLREIKTRVLPEIDEAFFEDLGYDKVTDEASLKEEVKKIITERKEQEVNDKYTDEVLNKAISNMEVEINEEIIDDEVHRMIHQFEEQLKMQGLNLEQYMEFTKTTHEDMHKNMEGEAVKRIKARFLLEEVAEVENITVSDEEAEKDAEDMAVNYGITKEELLKAFGGMEVVKYDAKMRKTLKFMQEN